MAGIDKMYVKSWEQYQEIRKFVNSYKERVLDEYGNKFYPSDFLADYSEEYFKELEKYQRDKYLDYYSNLENYKKDKEWFVSIGDPDWEPDVNNAVEIPIFNNPIYFDVWLIRNCRIDFVQNRLRKQYSSSYENILNKTSEFDTTIFNRSHKFSVIKEYNARVKNSDIWWWIQIYDVPEDSGMSFSYNEETGMWYEFSECREISSNTFSFRGNLSKRKLARLMKKWNLPVGVTLVARGLLERYEVKTYKIRVK